MTLMFLYTIVPAEIIFADEEEDGAGRQRDEQLVETAGVRLLVRRDGEGGATVSRLLSTDPKDFLDERWQPGNKVWG